MSRITTVLLFILFVYALGCPSAQSVEGRSACVGQDCAKCHLLSSKEASDLLRSLDVNVQSIKHAPIQGMFEVLVHREDKQGVIYVDYAKKHIMQGIVVNVATMEAISSPVK